MKCFICDRCNGVVMFVQFDDQELDALWAWVCHDHAVCGVLHSEVYRSSALETSETTVEDPPLESLSLQLRTRGPHAVANKSHNGLLLREDSTATTTPTYQGQLERTMKSKTLSVLHSVAKMFTALATLVTPSCRVKLVTRQNWHLAVNQNWRCYVKGVSILLLVFLVCVNVVAQETTSISVPKLIRLSGSVSNANGQLASGATGLTFSLYKDDKAEVPVWSEIQNVQLTSSGRYEVLLGATKAEGLPLDLFTTGEARWLGVRVENQAEQNRFLLLSVPYALKAADSETLGGLPPSAFQKAAAFITTNGPPVSETTAAQLSTSSVTGSGTPNCLPKWGSSGTDLVDSVACEANGGISAPYIFLSNGTGAGWLLLEGHWAANQNYIESFNSSKTGSQNLAITGANATHIQQLDVAADVSFFEGIVWSSSGGRYLSPCPPSPGSKDPQVFLPLPPSSH